MEDPVGSILFCRWWRQVGEKPSLWAKLKLQFEAGQEQTLHQVLALGRLQALEYLSLNCWEFSEQSCTRVIGLLQSAVDHCPTLRVLSLDFGLVVLVNKPDKLARVAAMLVKFEEIDLTEGFLLRKEEHAQALLGAILRALSEEGSRLKILTLQE